MTVNFDLLFGLQNVKMNQYAEYLSQRSLSPNDTVDTHTHLN